MDATAPVEVEIALDDATLPGLLAHPPAARGLVVFVHGSGSGRLSSRNQAVARALQKNGFATLLFDLLTAAEEQAERVTRHLRFDIGLLARRLGGVRRWLATRPEAALPVGYFGASTGAAAALVAAAGDDSIAAVVSRGGRPDLAGDALPRVRAPTLLIVGGADGPVIDLNRQAQRQLTQAETQLVIVPRATHLFEEPGTLEEVERLAGEWFTQHLQEHADDLRRPPPRGPRAREETRRLDRP